MTANQIPYGASLYVSRLEFPAAWDVSEIYSESGGVTLAVRDTAGTALMPATDATLGQSTTLASAASAGERSIVLAVGASTMSCGDRLVILASADGGEEEVEVDYYVTSTRTAHLKRDLYRSHSSGATVYGAFATVEVDLTTIADVAGRHVVFAWDRGDGVSPSTGGDGVATEITCTDEASDTICYIVFVSDATGDRIPHTNTAIRVNASTGVITASGFAGPLVGNVTGDCSGSSGSCTGNAATATSATSATSATTATNATNIALIDEASDQTCFPVIAGAATGNQAPKTSQALTFDSATGTLGSTNISTTKASMTSAVFASEYDCGNSGSTKTIDWANGQQQKITMTDSCTLTFTAPSGPSRFTLKVIQGETGSYTLTYPATVRCAGGVAPTLSTTVGAIDILAVYYDGVLYHIGMAIIGSAAIS